MSGFKDMVAADIDNVFLNEDEFAETHTLEGNTCVCVITNDRTKRVTRSARNFSGLHGDFLCVVVKTSSLQREPKQGENFRVDSKLIRWRPVQKIWAYIRYSWPHTEWECLK